MLVSQLRGAGGKMLAFKDIRIKGARVVTTVGCKSTDPYFNSSWVDLESTTLADRARASVH